uniref:CCHC-type domain-containing protein n=1 Tax=Tanacetum cinerariifolium TaxID=118510 RepID=A0A699H025_TANCI|nr:hypothetical protein [Tanacetum cinerariifolium]
MARDDNILNDGDHPVTSDTSPLNVNGPVSVTTDTNGIIKVLPSKTAEEVVARERERKARITLLMALPEDHLAKFYKVIDVKEMWEAIKSRFEGLHKGYDRFQTLLSQLEIYGAGVSHEDANHKFLRSLPSSWSQVALIIRTKPGLDTLSFDDLYNNLRVFEHDFKGSSSYTDEVIHSLFLNQSSAPQLDYDDLEKINDDDMEEMDLKWQVAMISMRIKKFYKRTERKLQFDTKDPVGFDKTKVECFNCHKMRHFARDCRAKGNQDSRRRDARYNVNKTKDNGRIPAYQDDSKALVTIDGEDIDWFGHVEEDAQNYAMMAYSFSNSGYDNESVFMNKASDLKDTPVNDRFADEMHATSADESDSKPSEYASYESDSSVETSTSLPEPDDPHRALKDKGIIDSGCSRHMIGNKAHLADYQEFKGGSVAFGGSIGTITGKEKIKTSRLDFKDVYYMEELKHYNLFYVSQMCDKKNNVLFTDSDCLVLSPDFKLPDENQVLLKIPRQHNMYSFNLKNIDPSGDLACLFAKASIDESNKWHKRLGHVNFNNLNKLVNGNLVRGLPFKIFENNYTCVACQKGKQQKASYSFLPITFWAEAVNTACYVLNRVLVTKPQNKTPCEILIGKQSIISYPRPFGYHVTILNTIDQLGKFDGKSDSGFLVGYSLNSKAFRVYNLETKRVEENLHVNFLENKPNVAGKGHAWMFDLDYLTNFMNYEPVLVENQANNSAGPKEGKNSIGTHANDNQGANSEEIDLNEEHFVLPIWSAYSTTVKSSGDKIKKNTGFKTFESLRKEATHDIQNASTSCTNLINTASTPLSTTSPSRAFNDGELSYPDPSKYALPDDPLMPHLEDIYASPGKGIFTDSSYDDEGVVTDFNNLETTISVSLTPTIRIHTIHPKTQILGDPKLAVQTRSKVNKNFKAHAFLPRDIRKEEGIDYDEVFAPVDCIEAIRIFLVFASYMGFIVYQMDVKSAFLYGIINEEVYVSQPPSFVDPKFPNKVYKVVKALYGLHQAPRACSTKKSWCDKFEELIKNRFQMSSMGELTFFLGLQVKQKKDGIFISQDKYVAEILKKFDFLSVKTASTPIETQKPLVKDEEDADVDVHLYRSMIGSLMYLTAFRPDIMFVVYACSRFQVTPKISHLYAVKRIFRYLKAQLKLGLWYPKVSSFDLEAYSDSDYAGANLDRKSTTGGCQFLGRRLISWQCKKQTIVATSTIEAEYVATAHWCGQVLWIPNQLLDYRHHFIRNTYEKKLIQVLKIHTDDNVTDLLTKDLMLAELASPKQMDIGKDISNPLMAGRFPKTTLPTSSVSYALTASLTIRTSCIKQFWTTAKVKTINDEVRIQALIDEKRVNIKESSIRRTLKLDDAEGTSCLANAKIFDVPKQPIGMNLAALWHQQSFVFLQIRSSTSQGDMSHHKDIYNNYSLTKKVFANMKMVGTGFSGVVTPLFDNMLVLAAKEVCPIQDDIQSISIPTKPSTSKPHKKHKPKKQQTQAPKVPSPKPSPEHRLPLPSNDPLLVSTYKEKIKKLEGRVDRLKEENKILKELHSVYYKVDIVAPVVKKEKSFEQGRIIAYIDEDVEINLEEAQAKPYRMDLKHPEKVLSMQDVDDEEPAEVEEVLEVVTNAKLITELVTTAGATTTAEATKVSVPRRRRGVVIQDPEEATSTVVVHSEVQSKDKGKGILIKDPKSLKGQEQIEQDEAFARQLKGMTCSEIRPLLEKHHNCNQAFLEEVNEEVTVPKKEVEVEGHKREGGSLEKEITKKQKINEEAEELKSHLQIISNNDDDVYIEATPLASKIHIVDYKIHHERNKPYFKIIKADSSHIVWRDQKGRYGLAKRYPLTHFTLEQILNNVRLEVEEESEMSLELLRLVRRQLNEGYVPE